jgi:hypothetical protein
MLSRYQCPPTKYLLGIDSIGSSRTHEPIGQRRKCFVALKVRLTDYAAADIVRVHWQRRRGATQVR